MVEVHQTIRRPDGSTFEVNRHTSAVTMGASRAASGYVSAGAGQPAFWMSPADWTALLARAWEAAADYWHKEILPKHFTHAGATEYGYQGRTTRHNRRKLRLFGHTYPNVFSGEMRHQVMRAREVRASSKGSKVSIFGPAYLYAYRKDYKQADKAAELTTISENDARTLAAFIDKFIQEALTKDGGRSAAAGHRGPGLADAAA